MAPTLCLVVLAVVSTATTAILERGATSIPVANQDDFKVGDFVEISSSAGKDKSKMIGVGSIIISSSCPIIMEHPAGATVTVVTAGDFTCGEGKDCVVNNAYPRVENPNNFYFWRFIYSTAGPVQLGTKHGMLRIFISIFLIWESNVTEEGAEMASISVAFTTANVGTQNTVI